MDEYEQPTGTMFKSMKSRIASCALNDGECSFLTFCFTHGDTEDGGPPQGVEAAEDHRPLIERIGDKVEQLTAVIHILHNCILTKWLKN